MPIAGPPWRSSQRNPPPSGPSPAVIVLIVVLPIVGYVTGRYVGPETVRNLGARVAGGAQSVTRDYHRAAHQLFKSPAENGTAEAQFHLATLYEHGLGVPVDGNKAVDLYTKAAQQSFVPAEARLGQIYLRGTLVLQNPAKAREWLEKAARAGSDDAQQNLGAMYEGGIGVPVNAIEAYAWYAVAAAHGQAAAAMQRDAILKSLSKDEQFTAEARARALLASLTSPPDQKPPT